MSLELANVPQILTLFRDEGVISQLSMDQVVQELDNLAKGGKRAFAGELAIQLGIVDIRNNQPITKDTLDHYLTEQTARKAEAAVKDIHTIASQGTQNAPSFLQAFWGNNGVNPASTEPTLADAISAAANSAQNIVMLANANPSLAQDPKVTSAIESAAELARGIMSRSPTLSLAHGNVLLDRLEAGLKTATAGVPLLDRGKQPISIDDYIGQRFMEIRAGVQELSILKSPSPPSSGTVPFPRP